MAEADPLDDLLARLEGARARLEGEGVSPDDAVAALEELQDAARAIAAEIDRRRRALADERGDGQLGLL